MEENEFFQEIEHREVPWGDRTIFAPLFYQSAGSFGALFLASWTGLKALLPSPRIYPIRVTPWHGILAVQAYEYRESDIGPYNEVLIAMPISLDRPSPLFTGILRKAAPEPTVYIHQLPVTTEIALQAGIEFAGYPKFLATIEFEHRTDRVTCRLVEEGRHILTLSGQKLPLEEAPRSRGHILTARNGRLLRSEMVVSGQRMAASRDASHFHLELGDHPIARELQALGIGRMLSYTYQPDYQVILTPVIESLAA